VYLTKTKTLGIRKALPQFRGLPRATKTVTVKLDALWIRSLALGGSPHQGGRTDGRTDFLVVSCRVIWASAESTQLWSLQSLTSPSIGLQSSSIFCSSRLQISVFPSPRSFFHYYSVLYSQRYWRIFVLKNS
jgi:hypothetical protein